MMSQQPDTLISARHAFIKAGRFAAVAALSVALACGDDSSTGPEGPGQPVANAVGMYTLRTVDGDPVPSTLYEDPALGEKYEILSGSVNLKVGDEFIAILRFRDTFDGVPDPIYADTSVGTWSKSGNIVTFVDDLGTSTTASLTTAGLVAIDPDFGGTLVFKK